VVRWYRLSCHVQREPHGVRLPGHERGRTLMAVTVGQVEHASRDQRGGTIGSHGAHPNSGQGDRPVRAHGELGIRGSVNLQPFGQGLAPVDLALVPGQVVGLGVGAGAAREYTVRLHRRHRHRPRVHCAIRFVTVHDCASTFAEFDQALGDIGGMATSRRSPPAG
jgi:hypothetical protein